MFWYGRIDNGFHRVNHAAVAVGKKIYSFGGSSKCCSSDKIDVFCFDTEELHWSSVKYVSKSEDSIPLPLFGHTVVEYQNKIYLFGGQTFKEETNPVLYCFDLETCEWSLPNVRGEIPDGVDGHTASVVNNHMYIIGGYNGNEMVPMNIIPRLNLQTLKWEKMTLMGDSPIPCDFHSASVIGNKIYVFGGRQLRFEDAESYSSEIKILDTEIMIWKFPGRERIFREPVGRRSHSAVVYHDEIYIFFGYNGVRHIFFNEIVKYNPISNNWCTILPKHSNRNLSTPCGRRRQCCVLVGDRVYAFGGASPENTYEFQCNPSDNKLQAHLDLFIFDFFPTLRNQCLFEVVHQGLNCSQLPSSLLNEVKQLMMGQSTARNVCKYCSSDAKRSLFRPW